MMRCYALSPVHPIKSLRLRCPRATRWVGCLFAWASLAMVSSVRGQEPIPNVPAQAFKSQVERIGQALEYLGVPFRADEQSALQAAFAQEDAAASVEAIQRVLDARVLAHVHINPESRVKVAAGNASPALVQQGWRVFLVKVHNEGGVTAPLKVGSPQAQPLHRTSSGAANPPNAITPRDVENRWLDVQTFDAQPLVPHLSGLAVEYRVLQLYSRDAGPREAVLAFDVGQGTQDLGFRNELAVLFDCAPAVPVVLEVRDEDGSPTLASFVFRDGQGHVYPARSRRLAPDFFFHDQVYRNDGESVLLPPGEYTVRFTRGPEYRVQSRPLSVPAAKEHREAFQLRRWIKLADHGWFSGDHHVHAAGCAHYESPTQGVTPADMMRHVVGEDLNVGCVLAWGPCWYHQKQFFEGETHRLSTPAYLMRYDVEVSGFPSSHTGHLCLLNLRDDDYEYPEEVAFDYQYGPESGSFRGRRTEQIGQWPSWDLPVLQWGKRQGGVVGFSHSGFGLEVSGAELPNYQVPRFDGIGANEYIVDVCHDACDFISSVDTPAVWELNIWYHTLNCGYTCRISGETDFPCIYGDRVGLGRVYVQLPVGVPLDYEAWVEGIRAGRSYVGDGLSHLFDLRIAQDGAEPFALGAPGKEGRASVLAVDAGKPLTIALNTAAMLEPEPNESIRRAPLDHKPYWHLERARLGDSRRVPVELIVNGQAVARQEIEADGTIRELEFDYTPERSCWIAVRIFPSCHTNPIFVEVDGNPIRASRRSATWCLESVERCWQSKVGQMRDHEIPAAQAAYEVARAAYRRIWEESFDDQTPAGREQ